MSSKAAYRESVEGRFVRFFGRFPVSAVFLVQYLAFVVYPELRSPTGSAGIIFVLIVVGVGGALWSEVLLSRLAVRGPKNHYPPTRRLILFVFFIGAAASLVALAAGAGTYEVQIGTRSVGAAASLATPFIPWKNFGVWLAIWSSRNQSVSKKFALTLFALSIVLDLYLATVSAIFGSFFATTFVTLLLAVLAGLVKLRSLVIAAVLVALLWPPLFNLRNQRRIDVGANVAELGSDQSLNRLELNKYFVEFRVIESTGRTPRVDLLKELRFGFIPRTFDSGRGNLSTANALSIAANLGDKNSVTFTVFGNVYLMSGGILGVLLYSISIAGLATYLRKRGSAIAFLAFGLVLLNFVWIESGWPDSIASFIQSMISLGFAMLFLRALRPRDPSRPAHAARQVWR